MDLNREHGFLWKLMNAVVQVRLPSISNSVELCASAGLSQTTFDKLWSAIGWLLRKNTKRRLLLIMLHNITHSSSVVAIFYIRHMLNKLNFIRSVNDQTTSALWWLNFTIDAISYDAMFAADNCIMVDKRNFIGSVNDRPLSCERGE